MTSLHASSPHTLHEQFPIVFANGYKIDSIGFWCRTCLKIAHPMQVHGQVSRLVKGAADVRAVYECPCGCRSEYLIRLKDDKSFRYLDEAGWHTGSSKLSRLQKLRMHVTHLQMQFVIRLGYWHIGRELRKLKNWLQQRSWRQNNNGS